jgi:cytidylate kinase
MQTLNDKPAQLVMILGPSAVGKMTVGQELANITGYKLLTHNMVVDLLTHIFPFGTTAYGRLKRQFEISLIDAAAETGTSLIFTFGLVFSAPNSRTIIDELSAPFVDRGGRVSYVELAAPLDVRLARNQTPNRHAHKRTDWSTQEQLRKIDGWGRWNSSGDFPYPEQHIVIDNSELSAESAARVIVDRFQL